MQGFLESRIYWKKEADGNPEQEHFAWQLLFAQQSCWKVIEQLIQIFSDGLWKHVQATKGEDKRLECI